MPFIQYACSANRKKKNPPLLHQTRATNTAAIRLQCVRAVPSDDSLEVAHTHMHTSAISYRNITIRRITWLPKACRNAAVRKQVAEAVIKAICGVTASETTPDKVVVRARRRRNTPSTRFNATTHAGFGESTDAFPLPKGYSLNPDLQAHPHASSEIGIGSEDPIKGPQK